MRCSDRSGVRLQPDPIRLAILLLILLAATACGGRGQAVAAPPQPRPVAGGTLHFGLNADPTSVTPLHVGEDRSGLVVARNVFAGLVDVDPSTLRLVPAIAERWSSSADGRTFTFHLRTGVGFQRGLGAVTAATFVRDWSLLCNPEVDAAHAWVLAPVQGYDRCRHGAAPLSGVRARGPQTLVVRLSEPFRQFATTLADPATWAFPPQLNASADARAAFEASPAGAGPFQIASWTRRDTGPGHAPVAGELVLERFPGYYGRPPLLDRVDMPVVDPGNPAAAFSRYRSGQLDVLEVAPTLVDAVRADPRFSRQLVGYPQLQLVALQPAPGRELGEQLTVARAIAPSTVATQAFGKAGQAADGMVPAGTPGYVPATAPPLPAGGTPPAALSVTVAIPAQPALRPIADAVVTSLRRAGIRARLAAAGDYRLADVRAPYPAADAFLAQLAGTPEAVLLAESRAAADPQRAQALQLQAERLLQRRAAVVPLTFGELQLLVAPRVQGFVDDGLGAPSLATVWLRTGA